MGFQKFRDRNAMIRAGWDLSDISEPKECRECGQLIQWCVSKNGKNVSLDAEPEGSTELHFLHCGKAGVRRGSEVESPNRGRDLRRANQPASESAPAPAADHTWIESLDDNSAALRALTAAILASLEARKATAPPAPRVPMHKTDSDGCPYTEYPPQGNR